MRNGPTSGPESPARAALGAAREVAVVLVVALLLSLLITPFLAQAFFIPSGSMENTLLVGDRVLVSKLTPRFSDVHRGDVVVFSDPGGWLEGEGVAVDESSGVGGAIKNALAFVGVLPQDSGDHLIKRVIGVPGDHVTCCDVRGRVTVNGVAVDETAYLHPGETAGSSPCSGTFDVTVPAGDLWVMGDNRSVSADSRCHQSEHGGMVPLDDVVGRAFVVVWPLDRLGSVSVPDQVFAGVPAPKG